MPRLLRSATPVVALLAALTLVAGACGDDSKDSSASDKKTTTTSAEKKTTTTATGSTSSTVSPAEFDAALSASEQKLEKAAGDPCAIAAIFQATDVPPPANAEQGKRLLNFYTDLLTAVADTAPAANAADAQAIRTAIKDVQAEASAANYSADFFNGDTPKAFSTDGFKKALNAFQTQTTSQCGSTTTTPGATPSTTTGG